MADKKISDFTEATSVAANDWLEIENAAGNSRKVQRSNFGLVRGAMVKKSADQTAADYSASPAIAWDAEIFDTDSIHDNSTNNSRLTVPSGVTYVRCGAHVRLANVAASADIALVLSKNGSSIFNGACSQQHEYSGSTPRISFTSGPIPVAGGDYFESLLGISGDASIDITASISNFWMEILA